MKSWGDKTRKKRVAVRGGYGGGVKRKRKEMKASGSRESHDPEVRVVISGS
jgi:hypothetical protein